MFYVNHGLLPLYQLTVHPTIKIKCCQMKVHTICLLEANRQRFKKDYLMYQKYSLR